MTTTCRRRRLNDGAADLDDLCRRGFGARSRAVSPLWRLGASAASLGPGVASLATRRMGAHVLRAAIGLTAMALTFSTLLLLPLAPFPAAVAGGSPGQGSEGFGTPRTSTVVRVSSSGRRPTVVAFASAATFGAADGLAFPFGPAFDLAFTFGPGVRLTAGAALDLALDPRTAGPLSPRRLM